MIRFGPAGNETSFYDQGYKNTFEAMEWLNNMGLNAYEYQCGRGVNIKEESAKKIGEYADRFGIAMSLHAPYFINMATTEVDKIESSLIHMRNSYTAAKQMKASRVCVHPGSFKGDTRENAIIRAHHFLKNFLDDINDESVIFCPEVMGKINQLGNLEEIIYLCAHDERILPTVDFGHLNARTHGSLRTAEDYEQVVLKMIDGIGMERTRIMHMHFSQIEYTEGGEKKHLTFEDTQYGPFFKDFIPVLYKYDLKPVVICESDDRMATDSLKSKTMYEQYRNRD
ncbi:MAG TPA: TIM barrel protein [Clostridia bacterium]|nr:MAG: putative endonuclease 4 [Firmicutes bacterium ADurb.Bin146]HOD92520.1 TIM barrel protein [Clostridia bacterium]HQM39178.1 TIM barrel protein [Clostridia bacterium]